MRMLSFVILENQFDIKITKDVIYPLKKSSYFWIWVLKPFTQRDYEEKKENLWILTDIEPDSSHPFIKKERAKLVYDFTEGYI